MSNVDEAINALYTLEVEAKYHTVDKESIGIIIDLLENERSQSEPDDANKPKGRSGPVITKREGIIVCVTWQDEEGRIEEVLAESCGYTDMKAREAQALKTIQNLIGAFDNPVTRRKVANETTSEAIAQGRAYIEQHKPDDEEGNDGL